MTTTPPGDPAPAADSASADASVDYDQLDRWVRGLHLGTGASELHGSVCGYLAGGGSTRGEALLAELQLEGDADAPSAGELALLGHLVQQGETSLADPEMGFEPLLPADDRPLAERADALAEWCRGFLGGFGLAGAPAHAKLTAEAQEMLRDLGAIAGSSFDYGDADEDEDALIEVQEFVRVGAMLLHAECSVRDHPASGRVH